MGTVRLWTLNSGAITDRETEAERLGPTSVERRTGTQGQ